MLARLQTATRLDQTTEDPGLLATHPMVTGADSRRAPVLVVGDGGWVSHSQAKRWHREGPYRLVVLAPGARVESEAMSLLSTYDKEGRTTVIMTPITRALLWMEQARGTEDPLSWDFEDVVDAWERAQNKTWVLGALVIDTRVVSRDHLRVTGLYLRNDRAVADRERQAPEDHPTFLARRWEGWLAAMVGALGYTTVSLPTVSDLWALPGIDVTRYAASAQWARAMDAGDPEVGAEFRPPSLPSLGAPTKTGTWPVSPTLLALGAEPGPRPLDDNLRLALATWVASDGAPHVRAFADAEGAEVILRRESSKEPVVLEAFDDPGRHRYLGSTTIGQLLTTTVPNLRL